MRAIHKRGVYLEMDSERLRHVLRGGIREGKVLEETLLDVWDPESDKSVEIGSSTGFGES
jgi:hypothetical protein